MESCWQLYKIVQFHGNSQIGWCRCIFKYFRIFSIWIIWISNFFLSANRSQIHAVILFSLKIDSSLLFSDDLCGNFTYPFWRNPGTNQSIRSYFTPFWIVKFWLTLWKYNGVFSYPFQNWQKLRRTCPPEHRNSM